MKMMLAIILSCFVLMATAQHSHEDVGEYGNYNTWRKAVCEKNDAEMFNEMDECFKLEQKSVQDAAEECAQEAHPESEGKLTEFMTNACGDLEIFKKFDTCFEEYESNPAFRSQMEITDEIEACYDKVLANYGMNKLRTYLKDFPFAKQ